MKPFLDEEFLLETETARKLYHEYAEDMPIIDYHCHLTAKEICENKPAVNLSELWLNADHYKWRLMRANGEPERVITGNASGYEKFLAFARTLTYAIGNPLYHWSHLELQRYFGITEPLNEESAPRIWEQVQAQMDAGKNTPRHFIEQSNVYALCTTEDPIDDLSYHRLLREEGYPVKVLPAMRPDAVTGIGFPHWADYLSRLAEVSGQPIASLKDLKKALSIRMDAFEELGCIAADHGFERVPANCLDEEEAALLVSRRLKGEIPTLEEEDGFRAHMLVWLGKEYYRRGWAMELHMGGSGRVNTRKVREIGGLCGFDSIGDLSMSRQAARLLDRMEETDELPKTILFSLNEKDNRPLAAVAAAFQTDEIPSKVQLGTAWWFQDHKDGMERQMKDLADEGLLGRFIGMLTDSRSFLSYTRHEYFRRILCNLLGDLVESGQYPADWKALEAIVKGICFENAKHYFNV